MGWRRYVHAISDVLKMVLSAWAQPPNISLHRLGLIAFEHSLILQVRNSSSLVISAEAKFPCMYNGGKIQHDTWYPSKLRVSSMTFTYTFSLHLFTFISRIYCYLYTLTFPAWTHVRHRDCEKSSNRTCTFAACCFRFHDPQGTEGWHPSHYYFLIQAFIGCHNLFMLSGLGNSYSLCSMLLKLLCSFFSPLLLLVRGPRSLGALFFVFLSSARALVTHYHWVL